MLLDSSWKKDKAILMIKLIIGSRIISKVAMRPLDLLNSKDIRSDP
jgi:hypothetical protein